jgi:hypothetical protein
LGYKNGEAAYNVDKSICGKKGIVLSSPRDIGHRVFVSDADIGTTIKTEIKADEKCHGCGSSHLGVIGLPQHVRPYEVFSV